MLPIVLNAGGGNQDDKLPNKNAFRRLGTLRFRSGDGILSLACSADGKVLASGGRNEPVRLWDAQTGQVLRQFNEHWVWAVAISPDGKTLATGGANKVVRLWDIDSGKERAQCKGHKATIKTLAFSSDGAALASGSDDNTVRLWKVAGGSEVAVYGDHALGVTTVAISPDSKHFASGSTDRTIRVWEWGEKNAVLHTPAAVTAIAYLPDRKKLIAAGDDGFVRIWDIGAAQQLRAWMAHDNAITHMTLSHDGTTLATTSGDNTVRIWDVAKGAEICRIARHKGDGDALAMSPDAKLVAAGGLNNTIRRWNAATGKPLPSPDFAEGVVTAVVCSPNGQFAAAGFSTNQVALFDLASGKERSRLRCGPEDAEVFLAFSGDGRTLATASGLGNVILWDVAGAKENKRFVLPERDEVRCLAYGNDGSNLAVGYTNGGLRIWETSTGKVDKNLPVPHGATAVAFSRDGTQLAVASEEVVTVYDTRGYRAVRRYDKLSDTVACLAFAPDGRTLAAGMFANTIQLFDVSLNMDKTGAGQRTLEGHRGVVTALAWSNNGRCLVSAGFDKTVRMWEFVNGQLLATWTGHSGEVTAVAMHPSGRTVISGGRDTTLLLWDAVGLGLAGALPEPKPTPVASLDVLWKELAFNNGPQGNQALWTMVAAKDCAEYLAKKVFLTDPKKIKEYIEQLDSPTFNVREKAFTALAGYERWVEDFLRKALNKPASEEVRQRVALLLKRLDGQTAISLQQERLRVRRVIEVLEQVNTPASRNLLHSLAAGAAEEELRDMAQAAFERLSKG